MAFNQIQTHYKMMVTLLKYKITIYSFVKPVSFGSL